MPATRSDFITLIILVSHGSYYDGIGIIKLNIHEEIILEESNSNQIEVGQKSKLNITIESSSIFN